MQECAEQWNLRLEDPFPDAYVSHVAPAGDRVLKVHWPHHESEHEAAALELWDGDGAVRLLAQDPTRNAIDGGFQVPNVETARWMLEAAA